MSGGGLLYIQDKNADAFINDTQLLEALQKATIDLVGYGELGKKARLASASIHGKLTEARREYLKRLDELDEYLRPLKDLWTAMDNYEGGTRPQDDVLEALERYNAAIRSDRTPA